MQLIVKQIIEMIRKIDLIFHSLIPSNNKNKLTKIYIYNNQTKKGKIGVPTKNLRAISIGTPNKHKQVIT